MCFFVLNAEEVGRGSFLFVSKWFIAVISSSSLSINFDSQQKEKIETPFQEDERLKN